MTASEWSLVEVLNHFPGDYCAVHSTDATGIATLSVALSTNAGSGSSAVANVIATSTDALLKDFSFIIVAIVTPSKVNGQYYVTLDVELYGSFPPTTAHLTAFCKVVKTYVATSLKTDVTLLQADCIWAASGTVKKRQTASNLYPFTSQVQVPSNVVGSSGTTIVASAFGLALLVAMFFV